MPSRRAVIFLILSISLSALAVWSAVRWVNHQVESKVSRKTIKVVVAGSNIPAGQVLTPGSVRVMDWPANEPLNGAFQDPQKVVARVTSVNIGLGEPIMELHLAPPGSRPGLAALIAPGMRAISMQVNDITGVAGFPLPDSRVDVLVEFQDDQGHPVSKTVLQNVRILALAQDMAVGDDVKSKVVNVVTVEVTPEQAEKLELAKSVGNVSLALRNQVDKSDVVTNGVRKVELLGAVVKPKESPAKKAEVKKLAEPEVELIRGTTRSTVLTR